MLFNTGTFFLFFAVVLALYYLLPHRKQNWMLLAASYLFYGWWEWRFLSLLLLSTVIDFVAGLAIQAARGRGRVRSMRLALTLSVGGQLVILGFFKYFNFFVDSAAALLSSMGFQPSVPALNVILPVGISFYTFQTMSYTIDIYRGAFPPTRTFVDFALSVAFFPHLVAGPIQRARSLIVQIELPRVVTRADWEEGLLLFALGLFRKVAIADPAGVIADGYFANPAAHSSVQLAVGLALYALQIYNDFAGYSDMARGCARLMGFTLMRNFRHPYFATSFSDFWQRWHISLSSWLRDYLYIPLGGNRYGRLRTHTNLMVTMLLGGLWHGASWTFVAWGALHGTYLIAQHAWTGVAPRLARYCLALPPFANRSFVRLPGATWLRTAQRVAAAVLVFALVNLAWLFFRAPDFGTAAVYLKGILALTPGAEGALVPFIVLAAFTLFIDVPQALADNEYVFLDWPVGQRSFAAATACLIFLASGSTHAPFIYFQF